MHIFFMKENNLIKVGSLFQCFGWAFERIQENEDVVIKIIKARPKEGNGRVVFEITKDGGKGISGGSLIPLSILKKAAENEKAQKSGSAALL